MCFLLYLIFKDLYIYYLLQFDIFEVPKDVKHWWFANKSSQNIIQSNYNNINRYYRIKKRQSPIYYVEIPFETIIKAEIKKGVKSTYILDKTIKNPKEFLMRPLKSKHFVKYSEPYEYLFQKSKNFTHVYSSIIDYHFGLLGRNRVPNRYLRFTEISNPLYINTNVAPSNMHFRFYKPTMAWQNESLPTNLNFKNLDEAYTSKHSEFILRYTTCDLLFPYVGLFFSQPLNSIDVKNRQIMELYIIRWRLTKYFGSFSARGLGTYPSMYVEDLLGRLNWGLTRREFLETNYVYLSNVFKNLIYEFLFLLPFNYTGFLISLHYFELLFWYTISTWLLIFPFFIPFIWLFEFLIIWIIIIIWPVVKIFIKYIHASAKDDETQIFNLHKEFWEFNFITRSRLIFFKNKFYTLFFKK
jgi:hypothetical protein